MHIYFSGIGGVGIGPLAMLALDAGYTVSGSDLQESPLTKQLRARGIQITIGQKAPEIAALHQKVPIDWFVYSSALPSDHPELIFAKENAIKTSKRAEFLNDLLEEKNLKLIAVAGTHGKTTTTAMLVWTLQQLGIPVSYSVGTTLTFGPPACFQPGSQYFVYECDEFDRNFLEFSPYLSLITTIDYDHPDTYRTEQEYLEAFATFAHQSEQLITWQDQHVELMSNHPDSWILQDVLPLSLPGQHNRRNATLVLKAIEKLGLPGNANQALEQFPGTGRRFEQLGKNLYTDYAHHPVEIAATISMAKEINPNVVVIYQPHQNIRQHELLKTDAYRGAFEQAKHVYWLPTYQSREDTNLSLLSPEELIASAHSNQNIEPARMDNELWQKVEAHRESGDLVLAMSAGDLDGWLRQQLTSE